MKHTFEERKQVVINLHKQGHSASAISSYLCLCSDYVVRVLKEHSLSEEQPEKELVHQ